jgi:hypothetical protein
MLGHACRWPLALESVPLHGQQQRQVRAVLGGVGERRVVQLLQAGPLVQPAAGGEQLRRPGLPVHPLEAPCCSPRAAS